MIVLQSRPSHPDGKKGERGVVCTATTDVSENTRSEMRATEINLI